MDAAKLIDGVLSGDRRAVARAISAVEDGSPDLEQLSTGIYASTGRAATIGITGAPGVGKSTLAGELVRLARDRDLSVAVLAVDPTSPYTGGALLGDRVRMQEHATDPGVFIRSMATRGHLGGMSLAAPEAVRILPRGNWLDETGEVVEPAVPHFLPQIKTGGRRATRLDLARWLTSAENPLTARVFVNRQWKLFFGRGLSRTVEDLGSQGEWPSHPELLDWLAVEFVESGWDVKRLVRTLVTSATYRQTSRASEELAERDPDNRLYARQARFRLDAEMVRDNALAISGLLSSKMGGPGVHPYQPRGYWSYLNFPPREWDDSTGEDQYRRAIYTWWQRTFPQPSLAAFDAPSREECVGERTRANVPQQALALLNDPTYVEAARVFAQRIVREGGATFESRLGWAYERAVGRAPRDEEARILRELFRKHAAQYRADPRAAGSLVHAGLAPVATGVDVVELAGWTSVARAILNLPEVITRS